MGPFDGDRLRGHLDALVLAALAKGDAHGLEIIHRLESSAGGLLKLREGSLYPALYRLEAGGKIRAEWESGPIHRRGARRRIYRLTSKGKRELANQRVEWKAFVSTIQAILGPI
jgi:PadR family transcriptional regulator, regulatory protein PadR